MSDAKQLVDMVGLDYETVFNADGSIDYGRLKEFLKNLIDNKKLDKYFPSYAQTLEHLLIDLNHHNMINEEQQQRKEKIKYNSDQLQSYNETRKRLNLPPVKELGGWRFYRQGDKVYRYVPCELSQYIRLYGRPVDPKTTSPDGLTITLKALADPNAPDYAAKFYDTHPQIIEAVEVGDKLVFFVHDMLSDEKYDDVPDEIRILNPDFWLGYYELLDKEHVAK
jgi:hypothetical protein